jgi:bifunctional UDP-N-acetylglucosamine pyrophosphorylase/glucosamine-1-phosphate N-acetyltransferase
LRAQERTVTPFEIADDSELGINDRIQLAAVRAIAQRRIHERHMLAGVTIVDPATTVIDVEVVLSADAVIAPFTSLHGRTTIGAGARVGPLSTLIDARVGAEASIVHSYVTGADVGDRVTVGPFAYLRPGAVLREGAKAGTFVEIKNSDVGPGAKVPHLSYIGDADIGERTNIGAGTITANYDGTHKHRTRIGARAFIGVDTMLVAPVDLGDEAYTGAGSVITEDVPAGALGIARERQKNVEGYTERRKQRNSNQPDGGSGAKNPAAGSGQR